MFVGKLAVVLNRFVYASLDCKMLKVVLPKIIRLSILEAQTVGGDQRLSHVHRCHFQTEKWLLLQWVFSAPHMSTHSP